MGRVVGVCGASVMCGGRVWCVGACVWWGMWGRGVGGGWACVGAFVGCAGRWEVKVSHAAL